jgi:hypothetical protein
MAHNVMMKLLFWRENCTPVICAATRELTHQSDLTTLATMTQAPAPGLRVSPPLVEEYLPCLPASHDARTDIRTRRPHATGSAILHAYADRHTDI